MTKYATLLVVAAVAAGCLPEKRISWAPDGSRALVISGSDNLYLTDADGHAERLAEGVAAASWMSDSKRLVVVRKTTLATWNEASAVLPEPRRKDIAQLALKLRGDLLSFQGEMDKFKPVSIPPDRMSEFGLMLLYLRDQAPEGLEQKLGLRWSDLKNAKVDCFHVAICGASDGKFGPNLATALSCKNPKPSPDGKAISYIGDTMAAAESEPALVVLAADGSRPPHVVARSVAEWADWSSDSRYLAFAAAGLPKTAGKDVLRLGTVNRTMIFSDNGAMLGSDGNFPSEELAGVLFNDGMKVSCLPDGRVLFSSAEIQLPATHDDMPQQMSLFAVDPQRSAMVVRMLPRNAQVDLEDSTLKYFEPSPDGKQAAIVGDKGQIWVVSLLTGAVSKVLQVDKDGSSSVVPVWRSNEELTFIAPAGSQFCPGDKSEVILLDLNHQDRPRFLSRDWPADMRNGLLDKAEAASQPASAS